MPPRGELVHAWPVKHGTFPRRRRSCRLAGTPAPRRPPARRARARRQRRRL